MPRLVRVFGAAALITPPFFRTGRRRHGPIPSILQFGHAFGSAPPAPRPRSSQASDLRSIGWRENLFSAQAVVMAPAAVARFLLFPFFLAAAVFRSAGPPLQIKPIAAETGLTLTKNLSAASGPLLGRFAELDLVRKRIPPHPSFSFSLSAFSFFFLACPLFAVLINLYYRSPALGQFSPCLRLHTSSPLPSIMGLRQALFAAGVLRHRSFFPSSRITAARSSPAPCFRLYSGAKNGLPNSSPMAISILGGGRCPYVANHQPPSHLPAQLAVMAARPLAFFFFFFFFRTEEQDLGPSRPGDHQPNRRPLSRKKATRPEFPPRDHDRQRNRFSRACMFLAARDGIVRTLSGSYPTRVGRFSCCRSRLPISALFRLLAFCADPPIKVDPNPPTRRWKKSIS